MPKKTIPTKLMTLGFAGLVLSLMLFVASCGNDHRTLLAPVMEETSLPVFPGAEGAGTKTKAGRGGRVIFVTNLNNSGAGSLREALEAVGPRIVIFKVSGIIDAVELLFISHPYITVVGQTAPGKGILIRGAGLVINTHDVLVQHLRFRPGNQGQIKADDNDAIAVFGPTENIPGAYNVVIDHVSCSWSEDEIFSTWFAPHDITVSWSIFSEALNRSRHPKITHSAGFLMAKDSRRISAHHNLLAHNDFRNPLIQDGLNEFSYNLVYNWGELPAEFNRTDGYNMINFIGNRYKKGPSSLALTSDATELRFNFPKTEGVPLLYLSDNDLPVFDSNNPGAVVKTFPFIAPSRFPVPVITAPASLTVNETNVLARAGALWTRRDSVDVRIVGEYNSGTGKIIDSPNDVGGYPSIPNQTDTTSDADGDGMPDSWETSHGLNPNAAADANQDRDGDGYTNIEEYLFSLEA
ncbi:MAG: hypothetical protein JNM63_01625 [Spirochaetia bacterium]|nr:hypothetical protein [Spirochaetia bacterium]